MNNYEKYIEAKQKQYMEFWKYLEYKKKNEDDLNEKEKEEYERLKKVFIYIK